MEKDIQFIMNQTNYTFEESKKKLEFHNNYIDVIKEYMNIPFYNPVPKKIKSINQEIYKQIRTELNNGIKKYNEDNPINIEHAARNFQESEKIKS
jgi:beta-galactosidase beta subunit